MTLVQLLTHDWSNTIYFLTLATSPSSLLRFFIVVVVLPTDQPLYSLTRKQSFCFNLDNKRKEQEMSYNQTLLVHHAALDLRTSIECTAQQLCVDEDDECMIVRKRGELLSRRKNCQLWALIFRLMSSFLSSSRRLKTSCKFCISRIEYKVLHYERIFNLTFGNTLQMCAAQDSN